MSCPVGSSTSASQASDIYSRNQDAILTLPLSANHMLLYVHAEKSQLFEWERVAGFQVVQSHPIFTVFHFVRPSQPACKCCCSPYC